jgi:hypothetical protein
VSLNQTVRRCGVEPPGRRVLRRLLITVALVALTCVVPGTQQLSGRLVAVIGITREIAPVEARLQSPTVERIGGVVFMMEGAAVAQVCARFGVPLIVIRSVTDRAEGQAMPSYQRFVDLASRNAADLAVATVREWQKP